MAYHSDYVATDTYDQQSHLQIHRGRYEARLANYSPVEINQSPAQGRHSHRMPFESGCDLDHSVPSQSASYRLGGFFTPEYFSATSPTNAIHWVPLTDDVPCPPDKSNVDMRKERRRAQNRMAQRAFRDRKEKVIKSLDTELQRLMAINQHLSEANEAYARQISDLKEKMQSNILLKTPASSAMTYDTPYDLDMIELEHGFGGSVASLKLDCAESWVHWQTGECATSREARTEA